MSKIFTKRDCGCYIDGGMGDEHLVAALADLVEDLGAPVELLQDLTQTSEPEVQDAAVSNALDLLQSHTAEGLEWMLDAGDLFLVTEEVQ